MTFSESPFTIDEAGNLCALGSIILPARTAFASSLWLLDVNGLNRLHAIGFKAGRLHEDDGQKVARAARERIEAVKVALMVPDSEDKALEREALERGRAARIESPAQKLDPQCTWGDGPDVAINVFTKSGELVPFDFTADEADALAERLKACAAIARQLEVEYHQHLQRDP